MNIGIIGSGLIGGAVGRLWAQAGHHVLFSFSHDPAKLEALAASVGPNARTGTPADAVAFGDVILLSVHEDSLGDALAAAGPLDGKILIDTTNLFKADPGEIAPGATSAGEAVAARAPGARVVKAYNTLASTALTDDATASEADRIALFFCGDDSAATTTVAGLIVDSGFAAVGTGSLRNACYQEPGGPLYNKPLRLRGAQALAATLPSP